LGQRRQTNISSWVYKGSRVTGRVTSRVTSRVTGRVTRRVTSRVTSSRVTSRVTCSRQPQIMSSFQGKLSGRLTPCTECGNSLATKFGIQTDHKYPLNSPYSIRLSPQWSFWFIHNLNHSLPQLLYQFHSLKHPLHCQSYCGYKVCNLHPHSPPPDPVEHAARRTPLLRR